MDRVCRVLGVEILDRGCDEKRISLARMRFRERFGMLAQESGMTLQQLAEAIGLMKSTVRRLYIGADAPRFDTLVLISDFFGVSVDWLMGRTDRRE